MATATTAVSLPKTKGGVVPDRRARCPTKSSRRKISPTEHRAIARTADEFWAKEVAPNLEAIQHDDPELAVGLPAQSRRAGPRSRITIPGAVRRHGARPDLRHGGRRAHGRRRVLCRLARRARRHRHAAPSVFRHRSAEEAISAEARHRGNVGRLLPERAARRLRCAGRQDPRRPLARTASTTSSTARRCGSPTAARPICSPSSPKSAARQFTAFLVERAFPASSTGAEEKKMGIKGSSTTAVFLDNVPRARRERAGRNRAAATSSRSTF